MICECCMQEKTFSSFYGHLAQRLCQVAEVYQLHFNKVFVVQYEQMHRHEVNKIRNCATLFAHLLFTNSIEWSCIACIRLTEEDTTSSSRIFIKILFQQMAENLGMAKFAERLKDEQTETKKYMHGVFPRDTVDNARFAVNFFTSIGLGHITEDLREFLEQAPKILLEQKYAELLAEAQKMAEMSDD